MENKWKFAIAILIAIFILSWLFSAIISSFSGDDIESGTGNVAVINIDGYITSGASAGLFEQSLSSSDVVSLIKEADKNPEVKAIIFEINSGGGSPVGSAEIADAIKKSKKMTVAVVKDMGASGAYWVASSCNVIVANEMSFVGSVGVYGSYLEFTGLMEKYGVNYRRIVAGTYKDLGSPYKTMTPEEEALMQKQINLMHTYFINQVVENRKLTEEQKKEISTASIYLGIEAKDLNLIDYFGGEDEAVKLIEDKIKVKAKLVEYKKKRSIFDIIGEMFSKQSYSVGQGIGSSILNSQSSIRL